jgi:phosphoenolpyruvate carboxylase
VLTAHPTEVRRKSMIDHRNKHRRTDALRTSRADDRRGRPGRPGDLPADRACCGRPARCARERLYVADEVETALAYLRDIFLPTLPALYARWERALGHRPASFLRPGSWIGGDRDGNPFVTADSLRARPGARCRDGARLLSRAVHALGAELSISTELAEVTDGGRALAEASGDKPRRPRDEPYRRAMSGIYARLSRPMRS